MEREIKNHLWDQFVRINKIPAFGKVYNIFSQFSEEHCQIPMQRLFSKY